METCAHLPPIGVGSEEGWEGVAEHVEKFAQTMGIVEEMEGQTSTISTFPKVN